MSRQFLAPRRRCELHSCAQRQLQLRLQRGDFVRLMFAVLDKVLAMRIAAGILVVTALAGCADDVVYQMELTLEPGQAVVDLEGRNTMYTGPGIFRFEQRGSNLDEIKGWRFAVSVGNNSATNPQSIRPSLCKERCAAFMECDTDDVIAEFQRWRLRSAGIDPWTFASGVCLLPDGRQFSYIAD